MLPFLKNRQKSVAGVIMQSRKPDTESAETDDQSHDSAIMDAAKDLIDGIQTSDASKVADAFRKAFEALEKLPHEEVDHEEDNSFAGRNIAAAKESK